MNRLPVPILFGHVILIGILASACDSRADNEGDQSPIDERQTYPDEVELNLARSTIREVFAEEFRGAKTRLTKEKLVDRLIILSDEAGGTPSEKLAALLEARDKAIELANVDKCMAVLDRIEASFRVDHFDIRIGALSDTSKQVRFATEAIAFVNCSISNAYSALLQGDVRSATQIVEVAESVTPKGSSKKPQLLAALNSLKKEIDDISMEAEHVESLAVNAKKNPGESKEYLKVLGRYECFVLNKWNDGLEKLSRSGDPALSVLASMDIADPSEAGDIILVADGWWNVADSLTGLRERVVRERAAILYSKLRGKVTGLAEKKVESRLQQLGYAAGVRKPWAIADLDRPALVRALANAGIFVNPSLALSFDSETVSQLGNNSVVRDVVATEKGALVHGANWIHDGVVGGAFRFDGNDDWIEVPDTRLPEGNSARTVMFWFRAERVNQKIEPAFFWGNPAPEDGCYLCFQAKSARVMVGNWSGRNEVASKRSFHDGRWHHVCFVFDGESAEIYVDGRSEVRIERRYKTQQHGAMTVGRGSTVVNDYFRGDMDEFVVLPAAVEKDQLTGYLKAATQFISYR